jgi:hypothetical protein
MGKIEHGIYTEGDNEHEDIDPDELQQYFSTDRHRGRPESGAGHPTDEYDSDLGSDTSSTNVTIPSDVDTDDYSVPSDSNADSDSILGDASDADSSDLDDIAIAVTAQTKHGAVPVPKRGCPFQENKKDIFFETLGMIRNDGAIPDGCGLNPTEEAYSAYKELHVLSVGRKLGKEITVNLPKDVWYPRFVLWAQALDGFMISLGY